MSLYTFATTNFTTESDRRRRAFVDGGQMIRTIALFALVLATLVMAIPRSDAQDNSPRVFSDSFWSARAAARIAEANVAPRLHKSLPAARF